MQQTIDSQPPPIAGFPEGTTKDESQEVRRVAPDTGIELLLDPLSWICDCNSKKGPSESPECPQCILEGTANFL